MFYDQYQLAAKAQEALQRIKNNKAQITNEQVDNTFALNKANYAKMAFEEFDDEIFENKLKLDSFFFKHLIHNLPEQYLPETVQILENLTGITKQIYEHINVKPRTYGFNLQTSLNNSDEILENQAQNYINSFLRDNYYTLTSKQREEKYFPLIKPLAESFILENQLDEMKSIETASKVVLMEDLIRRICFPLTIQSFIQETLHDDTYGEMFEQEQLQDLWESFLNKSHSFAKLVSLIV